MIISCSLFEIFLTSKGKFCFLKSSWCELSELETCLLEDRGARDNFFKCEKEVEYLDELLNSEDDEIKAEAINEKNILLDNDVYDYVHTNPEGSKKIAEYIKLQLWP